MPDGGLAYLKPFALAALHECQNDPVEAQRILREAVNSGIADDLRRGRDGKPYIAHLRRMLARDYYYVLPTVPLLVNLIQRLEPRLAPPTSTSSPPSTSPSTTPRTSPRRRASAGGA